MPELQTTYTISVPVYRHDADCWGNAKAGALLRAAQQIAVEHAEAVGLTDEVYAATHTAYVLAKAALHVDRTPKMDETLTLITRPERCRHAVNKRITEFYGADGAKLAVLDSRWVLIDTDKRMILRKQPPQFDAPWAEEVPFALPMRMPRLAPEQYEDMGTRTAVYSCCDNNGHLNNTRYADIVCDALPWEAWRQGSVRDLMLFYHREVPCGENFALYRAQTGPLQYCFNGVRDGKSAFEACITLG